jgi:UDP-2,3-diacylglucosamine pyrophosphatase LpxH
MSPDPQDQPDEGKVLKFRTIWISDLHLGTRGCQADAIVDFLRYTESQFLYLIGDIVDGWMLKKRWYWPQRHNDIIQKIMRRAKNGAEIFYLPGNHDEAARDYCGLQFGGVLVTDSAIHTTAKNERLLIVHGDQFDSVMRYAKWLAKLGDAAYELALQFNRVFNYVRRKLGFPYWSLSAYLKAKVKKSIEYIGSYEDFIVEEARRQKVDGVVCGHIHTAELRKIGDIMYYNDGDWVESCTALVEDFDGTLRILDWRKERQALLGAPL